MESHNIYSKKGFTPRYRPWDILFTEDYDNKKEAMIREKQLKSAKGREYIWEVVHQKYIL